MYNHQKNIIYTKKKFMYNHLESSIIFIGKTFINNSCIKYNSWSLNIHLYTYVSALSNYDYLLINIFFYISQHIISMKTLKILVSKPY